MTTLRPLTREDLAKFLPDQRSIRAFEQLFRLVPDDLFVIEVLAKLTAYSMQSDKSNNINIDYTDFNLNPKVAEKLARAWWNNSEDTLNIGMGSGVVQRVGFEQYIRAKNNTGSAIGIGKIVGFDSVSGEINIIKYIANGTMPSQYFIGVTTREIINGDISPISTSGKVGSINTTGSSVSESWAVGDVLYASPTAAGELTKVRPTAPMKVVSVAIVLVVDSIFGEILVKSNITIGLDYAKYSDSTNQPITALNTAQAVTLGTVETQHGISLGTPSSRIIFSQSGLYQVAPTLQVTSSSGALETVYLWIRKNGVDVVRSRADATIQDSTTNLIMSGTFQVSVVASDYVEIMWAASSASIRIDARAATAFAPAAPSAILEINQIQL
tara:strand:- start:2890 stop:4041 length:1152 start_codon:yes stop_codon:yes gene_type:complete